MKILHKDFHAYSSNEPILSFFLELLPASHYVFDKYNNFDPAIQWHECKSFPYVEGDGMYTGPDEIVQHIFMNIPKHFDGFTISVTDIFGSGNKVAMQGFYEGVYKKTGKRFKANAAHIWTVKDGKITQFFQAVDTATIFD